VRGHQDRVRRELSLAEQLNVAADDLATRALRLPNVTIPNLPTRQVLVTMNGLQISAGYTTILRDAYTSINLRKHLRTSNNWDEHILETLWWKPCGDELLCRPQGEHKTLIKYLHNRLPCNRKQHRYYGYISNTCSSCGNVEETQNHIMQCKNCIIRTEQRKMYIYDLNRYLIDSHTNTETRVVIVQFLTAWLNQQPLPDIEVLIPEASRTLKRAVSEQTAIGWDHWFKGRLTMEWATLYNHDLETANHGMRNQTAEKWGKTIVSMTWDFVLGAWKTRNDIEHSTEGDQVQNHKERLVAKIMWNKAKVVNFPTSYLSNITEEQIKDLPLRNLKMMDSQIQTLKRADSRTPADRINN
jgi:hypothetical protein